jgi:hypothetical protein
VLLGKIDGELVDDLTGISAQGSEESTVTIHDDEAELLVGLEQLGQSLGMELVVTQVKGGVDGLEGLEIDVDLSLLAFLGQDFTTVDDQTIRGDLVVQLQTLLGRGNGGQDGLSVDSRLDVGGGTLKDCQCCCGRVSRRDGTVRILQPTSWQLERLDPWELRGHTS